MVVISLFLSIAMTPQQRKCRWLCFLIGVALITLIATVATYFIVAQCDFLICEQHLDDQPLYWLLIVVDVVLMVVLIATLVRVLRLRKKWIERANRMQIEQELRNFYVDSIYNDDELYAHFVNPNVNRLALG